MDLVMKPGFDFELLLTTCCWICNRSSYLTLYFENEAMRHSADLIFIVW